MEQSQYLYCGLGNMEEESHKPPQSPSSTSTKRQKWCCLCSPVNLKSVVKEHPIAFAILFMTLTAITIGVGVGFGVEWQGPSSEGPCICENGKYYTFCISEKCFNHSLITRVPLRCWWELFNKNRGCFPIGK